MAAGALDLPPVRGAISLVAGWDRGRRDRLAILTYHRVDEPADDLFPGLISATPEMFDRQVAWLADAYQPVSLAEVLARRDGGPALPRRAVLITFDDAYRSFGDHAWPILLAHGVPAALFVPTAYPDRPDRSFWWDRLYRALIHSRATGSLETPLGTVILARPDDRRRSFRALRTAVKGLPHEQAMAAVDETVEMLGGAPDRPTGSGPTVLGWTELRALQAAGVEIGVHTRTHPLLDRLPAADLDGEIDGARVDLDRELDASAPAIAYPNGNHAPPVLAAVERAGLRLGFSTRRGTNDLRRPEWLTLRRINVSMSADRAALTPQLHGWLDRWT